MPSKLKLLSTINHSMESNSTSTTTKSRNSERSRMKTSETRLIQNYKKQNSGYTMDLLNKPEVFALLNHLLSLVQPKLHNIFYNKGQQRRPNNRPPMGVPGGQPGQAPRPMG